MKQLKKTYRLLTTIVIIIFISISASAQFDRLFYGVEIDGVLCGYTTSDVWHASYNGRPAIEAVDSVHLLLKALGQDMNADIISHYFLDPESYNVLVNEAQYNTSDVGRVITTRTEIFPDYAVHHQLESGISDTIQDIDDIIFDNPINSLYLIEDFVHGEAKEMDYRIFDFLKGTVEEQKFTLEGEEEILLADKNFTVLVFGVYNKNQGTNTRIWVDKKNAKTLQFEILNRRIFLSESSVIKKIKTVDLDNSIFAKVDKNIANFTELTYMKVKADIKSAGELISAESLNFPGQKFEGIVDENHIQGIFEMEPVRYDGKDAPAFPADYSGISELSKYLEPELLIESDHPDIIEKAKEITEGATDSWDAVNKPSTWVGKEIRGAVPGGSSAINTLHIREGECGSHSRLLAALCRASGIPSRMVIGCLYSPWYGGSFGQHAWNEVHMGENIGWVAIDATILEYDYVDAGHIKLGELATFHPESMEILEYHVIGEEADAGVPEQYKALIGPYMNPDKRDVLEVIYEDGSLTVDVKGRMKLALHDADEEGRMYAKLTDKVYFIFPDGNMHVVENAFAMKRADVEINIAEGTPEEYVPLMGPYMLFQIQKEFTVSWEDGLSMLVPDVEKARPLIEIKENRWRDTVDGKEYAFAYNDDGSINGMNIFIEAVLKPGASTSYIIKKAIEEDGIEAAREKFKELWDNRVLDLEHTESDMNNLGYSYLGENKLEEALMVFKLNVETFPKSWNVYDSYGEALMKNGNTDLAIKNYKKSLEINPDNQGAKEMLEKLNAQETK